ncbi:DNA-directed RNA polymerase I subunit RPA2 [Ixodes scapularis]|uniref:DNA-directed RNA polymerase I subunit RPA2 n=1 Tax=Ixodes scapularis TaxID=6945 RepID=UPI001A9D85D6|nr:DNA-directed RNA polymerase I subunit RPA2 [Ixodes scapularis]
MDAFTEFPEKPSLRKTLTHEFGKLPNKQYKVIQNVSKAHIESFNYMLKEGLSRAVADIPPSEFALPNGDRIKIEMKDPFIGNPMISKNTIGVVTPQIYPAECRNRGTTYRGKLDVTLCWSLNGVQQDVIKKTAGEVPIMVKSQVCNLSKLSPKELVQRGEESEEFGGYFVVNGNEKIIRMLIMTRRNYPIAMMRNSWKNRGKMYSEYGVSLRSVKPDQTGTNMVLHYLTNGTVQVMFSYMKEIFFMPVMMLLKALCDVTDYHIYSELVAGKENDSFYKGCIINMLRQVQNENLLTRDEVRSYIGGKFRVCMRLPEWYSDEQVALFLLRHCICIHLDSNFDKFNLILLMIKKLFALAKGECAIESSDNPMNHEVLLPGHLYLMVLKEKLGSFLFSIRQNIEKKAKSLGKAFKLTPAMFSKVLGTAWEVTGAMNYFLATGNVVTKSGLGLMQFSGTTVLAEKLNYWRYLSHFRCVHRGAFFAEMRTTTVRKLLPEAWGFLCPVHTPDGSPCGLLNHMTAMVEMVNQQHSVAHLTSLLTGLGMFSLDGARPEVSRAYVVVLDGRVLGYVEDDRAPSLVTTLRTMKAHGLNKVPPTLEIGFVPKTSKASQYPGLFLFSTVARMMRPVLNVATGTVEWIGTFEQVHLNISVIPDEAHEGVTTHQELRQTSMLSVLGNMIPYSDFNQSPRNMYQCQMGKQTMGTPCQALRYRSDNKLYRIQTPQTPFVRPTAYDHYHMDDFPTGTNAIVAVISYTGYDMEDAMVLNKSSVERGFKHGCVYKTELVNLRVLAGDTGRQTSLVFGRKATDKYLEGKVDLDGLPYIGVKVEQNDPVCSFVNLVTGETKVHKYKSTESAYIHDVKLLGNDTGTDLLQNICITYWIQRNPMIGDKFASRHGQKGVCSQLWPIENMPFTESGMTPDIIFNPHGFPSRMTIGMMIESMAGKSATLHGFVHDATPFKFSENQPASEYFGELLKKAGYNYHGTERMYSGVDGREMEANIFFGVVYYQRLRHMVADKYQVRTTGPVDTLTHQPVKGRKRAGGIRFGEMERDSLLAHGSSFLLQDRLFNCSDRSLAYVCRKCGSVLSPLIEKPDGDVVRKWVCPACQTGDFVDTISMPYVFRYLAAELAGINMGIKLHIK